jgi:peptidoglycan/xylan/chitin deacetylase (PgdA/CDA1 family)
LVTTSIASGNTQFAAKPRAVVHTRAVDEQQLAQLREWAERLSRNGDSVELRAAGRALDLATAEIERLRRQLERRTTSRDEPPPVAREHRPFDVEAAGGDEDDDLLFAPEWDPPAGGNRAANGSNGRPTMTAVLDRRAARAARAVRTGGAEPVPAPMAEEAGERQPPRPPHRTGKSFPLPGRGVLIAAGIAAALVAIFFAAVRLDAPDLHVTGPAPDAKIGAVAKATLAFSVSATRRTLDKTSWILDGQDVTDRARRGSGRASFSGAALPDGEHWLTVRADGRLPGARTTHVWHFTIDTSPPVIRIDGNSLQAPVEQPMRFAGKVDTGSTVQVDGRQVGAPNGRFAVPFAAPPAKPVDLVVTDPFGNTTADTVSVELIPRTPRAKVRAVHVTPYAWADASLRRGVLALIDQGRINTVELDLKDESGIIGFDAPIPVGRQVGAVGRIYDLPKALDTLHRRGVMVVGRIVAFRDPVYAAAAWKRGWRSQVIQTPDGQPYAGYGGFTNFASPAVRRYNVEIARVAAKAGIDDVLYDYVRRPDGPISTMRFPGLRGTPEHSIATFLGEARRALKPYGTFLGASVFGVAATRPTEVAQNIPAIGRNVDYVAPMVYPSHWAPGEYNVAYPNGEPYAIVQRSLKDFQQQVRGTGARVVPWLQDFSLGVTYGPAQVQAQIKAARADGITEWLLWDPLVTYTGTGLPRAPKVGAPQAKPSTRPPSTSAATHAATARSASAVKPNELGDVPVMMYHQIRADGGGPYDLTPAQFRAELGRLWREGYVPVRAIDLVTRHLDVPAGKTPVVLTFDDATKEQLFLDDAGQIKPDTAIGIMLAFQKTHPKFAPAGTFYINREPFAGVTEGPQLVRWLVAHGFEIGNHTKDHIPLNTLDATQAQRQLVLGQKVITDIVPDAKVQTFALPLGEVPTPRSLAWRGSWHGQSYRNLGVFEVGAEPAKSPYSTAFRPHAIPRIRTTPPGVGPQEFGSSWWLDILKTEPGRRYVSDGDPATISFPRARESELAPRFEGEAKPY